MTVKKLKTGPRRRADPAQWRDKDSVKAGCTPEEKAAVIWLAEKNDQTISELVREAVIEPALARYRRAKGRSSRSKKRRSSS